jgi:hypothetical protein
MKFLLLPVAALLSGGAWLAGRSPDEPRAAGDDCAPCPMSACSSEDCQVDVYCTDEGTCVITCVGENGQRCVIELACSAGDGGCRVVRCAGEGCEAPQR